MHSTIKWAVGLFVSMTVPAWGVTLSQVDDFQDGTMQNWTGGSVQTIIATGGPAGTGDQYLELQPGPKQKVGTKNSDQWSGDYLAEGITTIEMDINNFGPDELAMRIRFATSSGEWVTNDVAVLSAGSGWQHFVFNITESDLAMITAGTDYATAMSNVSRWVIRHDPDDPNGGGSSPSVNATIGIDNITATPEPTALLMMAIALPLLRRRVA